MRLLGILSFYGLDRHKFFADARAKLILDQGTTIDNLRELLREQREMEEFFSAVLGEAGVVVRIDPQSKAAYFLGSEESQRILKEIERQGRSEPSFSGAEILFPPRDVNMVTDGLLQGQGYKLVFGSDDFLFSSPLQGVEVRLEQGPNSTYAWSVNIGLVNSGLGQNLPEALSELKAALSKKGFKIDIPEHEQLVFKLTLPEQSTYGYVRVFRGEDGVIRINLEIPDFALDRDRVGAHLKGVENYLNSFISALLIGWADDYRVLLNAAKRVSSHPSSGADVQRDIPPSPSAQSGKKTQGVEPADDEEFEKVFEVRQEIGIRFDDVGGAAEALNAAKDLAKAIKGRSQLEAWGTDAPKGILLFGPPGNGKTLLGQAIASEAGAIFCLIHLNRITGHKWYGLGEQFMSDVFEKAKKLQEEHPGKVIILFFDEIDSVAVSRDDIHDETSRTQTALLKGLDGFDKLKDVVAIATTNRLEALDDAVKRPGRFDVHIEVPNPDIDGRRQILMIHAEARQKRPDVKKSLFVEGWLTEEILSKTDGFSGADLAEVIRNATFSKAIKQIETGEEQPPIDGAYLLDIIIKFKESRGKKEESEKTIGFSR
ncbi:hypothetical protein A2276_04060 [candidate division WOR-1 bacterium RIFOXYA12_FULL_43_27]|uniref:AAA+ ATPase domain-containing protein n=1 Tax=candidate division WOR-1 bacterium RIFOXYC2_FULL_46_14 TaxID=1802587 RepID=A0A1F4U6Y5_UNCSA|nr:MAG: hypothetical protein A2276_04060 [candidate division WOR-1 bacterium RIFOXYA12_FULL_43_27]OGC19136.1 MAG: hypothetical protein A2292_00275 [candidate division WOR-1 bacterium RIFOXYB2_FULL_46_45]OGC30124.1 MAG: hypothetical protein A2232_00275 [candidate division WOR-1 bacterium RIFOXYA2_FULL_46_56]OGC40726.1 MAG: hypothetical protein A2438_00280 [candidate division WOR-1 bacterium RIFOXYC2_FULL_46_14]